MARGTVPADPPAPVERGVRGDPGDAARVAPAAGRTPLGLHQPGASRTAVHGDRDPQAGDPHGDGEPDLGASAGARGADQARPPDRGIHGLADPARRRHRSRTTPHRPDLEAVPDRASPRHPRRRLRARGHRAAAPHLRPDRRRARHPPRSPGRGHRAPRRRVDNSGSAQLPDGSRPPRGFGQVLDQGSCWAVHFLLRRRVHGSERQDSPARRRRPERTLSASG